MLVQILIFTYTIVFLLFYLVRMVDWILIYQELKAVRYEAAATNSQ